MLPEDFLSEYIGNSSPGTGVLFGTQYNSSLPWGEQMSDWSSAGWGNGWAGTAGGVGRQLGLKGRALGQFARAVNSQKRRLNEKYHGGDWGYDPSIQLPSWIKDLYESKGMNTGGIIPTGKSGVGKYVDLGALGLDKSSGGVADNRTTTAGQSVRDTSRAERASVRSNERRERAIFERSRRLAERLQQSAGRSPSRRR